jgi:hypothetical protein
VAGGHSGGSHVFLRPRVPFLDRSFSMRFDVALRVAADLYAHIPYRHVTGTWEV